MQEKHIFFSLILTKAEHMGKKDAAAVSYFRDNERYADLINVYLFHGKGVLIYN